MEQNQDKKTISEIKQSQEATESSTTHSLPARGDSPAESLCSSGHSSISRGFPPKEEKLSTSPPTQSSPFAVVNRYVRDEPAIETVTKPDPDAATGDRFGVSVEKGEGSGGGRNLRPSLSILRKAYREAMMKKASLGFRVFSSIFCLISFSVMVSDRNKGWALDSFDRYKEFRYCMSVNVIGFVYSGAQGSSVAYNLATGKHVVPNLLRYYFDFAIDQMMTYLLISASSSATTRVDDWQSNWGEDKFPEMASASLSLSFLAFVAFAFSSLISGYNLCTYNNSV